MPDSLHADRFVVVDYFNLRVEFLDWNERGPCVQIPELLPLFLLHPLARCPSQRDLLPVQPELVQVLQGPAQEKKVRDEDMKVG